MTYDDGMTPSVDYADVMLSGVNHRAAAAAAAARCGIGPSEVSMRADRHKLTHCTRRLRARRRKQYASFAGRRILRVLALVLPGRYSSAAAWHL